MKNAIEFVSVEESALESVAGGLLDLANGSVNGNAISLGSNIAASAVVGDVGSFLLNVLNQVTCMCGQPPVR